MPFPGLEPADPDWAYRPSYRDGDPPDLDMDCRQCAPHACDDPDRHLGIPAEYRTPGCHCGADLDGRDCMCFE